MPGINYYLHVLVQILLTSMQNFDRSAFFSRTNSKTTAITVKLIHFGLKKL